MSRTRGGQRHFFRDEEPEDDRIDYDALRAMDWSRVGHGQCKHCGLGHPGKDCPDLYLHQSA